MRIPANTWNTLIDVARHHRQGETDRRSRSGLPDSNQLIVLVRNKTAEAQPRFGILGIDEVVITPDDNLAEFKSAPAFDGIVPTSDHANNFVILQAPAGVDHFARALLIGVTALQIQVGSEAHATAGITVGETEYATSGAGPLRILWKQAGTGLKWAVVAMGAGGASSDITLMKITARAGTAPPWLYCAEEVAHDETSDLEPENWETVVGGLNLEWTLLNEQEIGESGIGVAPIPSDSIVGCRAGADGFHYCSRSNYRGTF